MQMTPTLSRAAGRLLISLALAGVLATRGLAINHPAPAEQAARSSGDAAVPPTPVQSPDARVAATIRQTIEARFAGVTVLDVQPAPIPGLYEVYVGDRIVYADEHADYLLMGPLLDTESRKNLTAERMTERTTVDFASLPLERAIRIVKGDGSRRFAVFSDPDCPYCQRLEGSLLAVNNFTMYVFLFPIAGLHPQATAKAHAIWCAKDRAQAWNQWMHEKKLPSGATSHCTGDPVEELAQLADRLHVTSTPTLFFADGHRISGAIPAAEIDKLLQASSGPKSAAPAPHPP